MSSFGCGRRARGLLISRRSLVPVQGFLDFFFSFLFLFWVPTRLENFDFLGFIYIYNLEFQLLKVFQIPIVGDFNFLLIIEKDLSQLCQLRDLA